MGKRKNGKNVNTKYALESKIIHLQTSSASISDVPSFHCVAPTHPKKKKSKEEKKEDIPRTFAEKAISVGVRKKSVRFDKKGGRESRKAKTWKS